MFLCSTRQHDNGQHDNGHQFNMKGDIVFLHAPHWYCVLWGVYTTSRRATNVVPKGRCAASQCIV